MARPVAYPRVEHLKAAASLINNRPEPVVIQTKAYPREDPFKNSILGCAPPHPQTLI